MKKCYAFMLSAALLASAPSFEASAAPRVGKAEFAKNQAITRADALNHFRSKVVKNFSKKRAAKTTADEVITEANGVSKNYSLSATNFFYFWGYVFDYEDGGMVGNIVFDEATNTAYLKNPIAYVISDTYIKGNYTDSSISFSMPQALYEDEGETYYVHRMVIDEDNSDDYDVTYVVDDSEPVTFTIAQDGTITFDGDDDNVIIGLTDADGEWSSYGNYGMVYTPFNNQMLTISDMPADFASSLEDWMIISGSSSQSIKVAEYDGKMYIAGINPDCEDALIEGEINGTTVSFASNQWVGIDDYYNYYQLFYAMTEDELYDDYWEEYYSAYVPEDAATFSYDAENGVLTFMGETFGVFGGDFNNPEYIESYVAFSDATIQRVPEDYSYVPQAATDLEVDSDEEGTAFYFNIATLNEDGLPLNSDNIYYRIYVNGEVYTFNTDVYVNLDEDTTDLSYSLTLEDADNYYYDIYAEDAEHYVYFYEVIENPGVQVVYKDGDKEYCSEIVYVESASVNSTLVNSEIVSVSYTDLSGRTVVNPAKGLYIKTVSFSDGSQKATKVIVK